MATKKKAAFVQRLTNKVKIKNYEIRQKWQPPGNQNSDLWRI